MLMPDNPPDGTRPRPPKTRIHPPRRTRENFGCLFAGYPAQRRDSPFQSSTNLRRGKPPAVPAVREMKPAIYGRHQRKHPAHPAKAAWRRPVTGQFQPAHPVAPPRKGHPSRHGFPRATIIPPCPDHGAKLARKMRKKVELMAGTGGPTTPQMGGPISARKAAGKPLPAPIPGPLWNFSGAVISCSTESE